MLSRRAVAALAFTPALPIATGAAPDPILAAIDRMRAARATWAAALEGSPAELEADADLDRAIGRLMATVPTSAAGMIALAELARAEGLDAEHVLELVTRGLRRLA